MVIYLLLFFTLGFSIFKIMYLEKLLKEKVNNDSKRVLISRWIDLLTLLGLFAAVYVYYAVTVVVPD